MKNIITLLLIFSLQLSFAQAGTIDPTFNPSDIGDGNGDCFDTSVTNLQIQPDGKIIATGTFSFFNGSLAKNIIRLNTDGTRDLTFTGSGFGSDVNASKLLPNGKILAGGNFFSYNGTAISKIIQINSDGTRDTSFSPSVLGVIQDIAVQDDGKIIIVGEFTFINNVARKNIARLNADGTLDTTFDSGILPNQPVNTATIQPDGKIIFSGPFNQFNGVAANRIIRLNSNGTIDTSFSYGTGFNNSVSDVKIQPDSKILICGNFTSYNGTERKNLARLNSDGTVDTTFSIQTNNLSSIITMHLSSNGKITLGGNFTSINEIAYNRIARINSDGTLDTAFIPGQGADNKVYALAETASGKIIMGGEFVYYKGVLRNQINSINADGSVDFTFNAGSGANNNVYAILPLSSGKMLIGGTFSIYNGVYKGGFTKINSDGSIDTTFNSGTGSSSAVYALAKSGDKFIVGGSFSSFNGTSAKSLVRLNEDGTIDTTFNTTTGVNSSIYDIAIQTDGKIIIVGAFTTFNSISSNRIARINADGTLDTTFNIGLGANAAVEKVLIQPDGKIVIVGSFTNFDNASKLRIIRLNTDGSFDTSFTAAANSPIYAIARQTDGKFILGGAFTSINSTSPPRIARINADGTLDTTFNVGTSPNGAVSVLAVTETGKIVVGGDFTTFNSTAKQRIVQLNSNGGIDSSFATGMGANSTVNTLAFQNDGKLLIGGFFNKYNGTGRNRIARINTNETGLNIDKNQNFNIALYPNPSKGIVHISNAQNLIIDKIEVTDLLGKSVEAKITNTNQIDLSGYSAGIYIITINSGTTKIQKKIIVQ